MLGYERKSSWAGFSTLHVTIDYLYGFAIRAIPCFPVLEMRDLWVFSPWLSEKCLCRLLGGLLLHVQSSSIQACVVSVRFLGTLRTDIEFVKRPDIPIDAYIIQCSHHFLADLCVISFITSFSWLQYESLMITTSLLR